MGSSKHQKLMLSGKDKHHFYFPKKLYRNNRIMQIAYSVHHTFHNYFMAQCKKPHIRACKEGAFCKYEGICCYHGTGIEFGKKVPWGEVS